LRGYFGPLLRADFAAPFSEGGPCVIPKGVVLQVQAVFDEPVEGKIYAIVLPVDYEGVMIAVIPEEERNHPRFLEYNLTIDTDLFLHQCMPKG
jgi:hypothetical protein